MQGFYAQGRSATDLADASYTIPTHADFLYGYSTVEGRVSIKITSFFIYSAQV